MTASIVLAVLGLHCCAGFSVDVEVSSYSLGAVCGLLTAVASPVGNTGSRARGRSRGRMRAQELCCAGVGASQHVGSSRTGDRTCVSFIGRQILNHWTTRQVCLYYCYFLVPFVESFLALPL